MTATARDQARLDWVTKHLKLTHYIYGLADDGDATAIGLRSSIHERSHLTGTQINFATQHVRITRPGADLDESTNVIRDGD
jgi:hypothetical protein